MLARPIGVAVGPGIDGAPASAARDAGDGGYFVVVGHAKLRTNA